MTAALINVAGIPVIPTDPDAVEAAASDIDSAGTTLATTGADIASDWQGLAPAYHAPEAGQLLTVMAPVQSATTDVQSQLLNVTSALRTYASETRALKSQLDGIRGTASSFVADMQAKDVWNKSQAAVDQNNSLLHQVSVTLAAWQDAQRRCANTLRAMAGLPMLVAEDGSGKSPRDLTFGATASAYDGLVNTDKGAPWGHAAARDLPWYEDAWHDVTSFASGAWDSVWGMVDGLGSLVGIHGWEAMGQSWKGLGELGLLASPLGPVLVAINSQTALPGLKKNELFTFETNMGKSLLAWDEWKKDPARAAGMVFGNVITVVGTDGVGAVAKGTGIAAKVARLAEVSKVASVASMLGDARLAALAKLGDFKVGAIRGLSDLAPKLDPRGLKIEMPKIGVRDLAVPGGGSTRIPYVTGPHLVRDTDPLAMVSHDGGNVHSPPASGVPHTGAPEGPGTAVPSQPGPHQAPDTSVTAPHTDPAVTSPTHTAAQPPAHPPAATHPSLYQTPPLTDHTVVARAPGSRTPFAHQILDPHTKYEVPGRGTFYTDGTGKVVHVETTAGRKFGWNVELNKPLPDTTYVVHRPASVASTFTFHTDSLGRTDYVHVAKVEHLSSPIDQLIRSASQQRVVGKVGGPGYEGAHGAASRFGAPGERVNLFPGTRELNRGAAPLPSMTRMENEIARFLSEHPGQYDFELHLDFPTNGPVPQLIEAQLFRDGHPVADFSFSQSAGAP